MQYLGGKGRLARKFAPILQKPLVSGARFIEPFVGGFNLVPYVQPDWAICNDNHAGLIRMYQAVQSGEFNPPESLTEEEYKELKSQRDWDNPLTAFAAFGCSFGAMEFASFARNKKGDNYCLRARNSLLRKAKHMRAVEFVSKDYRELEIKPGDVVYADPPYLNTTAYTTGAFDHEAFYLWCESCASKPGVRVFVSEFTVPERSGWEIVWSTERHIMVNGSTQKCRRKTDYLVEVKQ